MADSRTAVQREFHVYGGNAVPFRILQGQRKCPDELLMEGPAGTGKSIAIGKFLWTVLDHHPDAVILVLRKTRVSLSDSFLDTFENQVLHPDHPSVIGKQRANRTKYVHPKGGEMRLAGFDEPRRLFSTEYCIIFVNEMTELTLKEWESLHRALRRKWSGGFHLLIGDANPDYGEHWANKRFPEGHMAEENGRLRVCTTHRDNPAVTKGYLRRLDRSMTGATRDRLFLGLWRTAEGLVYPMWDSAFHLLTGKLTWPTDAYGKVIRGESVTLHIQRGVTEDEWEERELRWFGAALDFGYDSPGAFGVWGVDGDRRAYQVRETYYSMKELDWWADVIFEAWQVFRFRFVSCDSAEPRSIKHINDRCQERGMPRICVGVDKPARKKMMFDHVRDRMKKREGRGGTEESFVYLLRDTLWAPEGEDVRDPRMVEKGRPIGLAEELSALVLATPRETEKGAVPQEESDPGCSDHSADQLGYFALHAWKRDLSKKKKKKAPPIDVHEYRMESARDLARADRRKGRRL